jgi:hypothetical protein
MGHGQCPGALHGVALILYCARLTDIAGRQKLSVTMVSGSKQFGDPNPRRVREYGVELFTRQARLPGQPV